MSEDEKKPVPTHSSERESEDIQPEQRNAIRQAAESATLNVHTSAASQEQATIKKPKANNSSGSLKPFALGGVVGAIAGAALATAFCFATHSDINWPSFNLNHDDSTKGLSIIDGNIHLNRIKSPILFDQNSAELDAQDTEILDIFAQYLKQNKNTITLVVIGGRTSAERPEQYYSGLSYEIAVAVRAYLESSSPNKRSFPDISVIFDSFGRGENDIVKTPASHQDNRRVEFIVSRDRSYTQ